MPYSPARLAYQPRCEADIWEQVSQPLRRTSSHKGEGSAAHRPAPGQTGLQPKQMEKKWRLALLLRRKPFWRSRLFRYGRYRHQRLQGDDNRIRLVTLRRAGSSSRIIGSFPPPRKTVPQLIAIILRAIE